MRLADRAFSGIKSIWPPTGYLWRSGSEHERRLPLNMFAFETPFGIEVTRIEITQYQGNECLHFQSNTHAMQLELFDPVPIDVLTTALDCSQIRIVDFNVDGNFLECGRYQLQFWNEDNSIGETTIDSFRLID